jgi:hypothetical protein
MTGAHAGAAGTVGARRSRAVLWSAAVFVTVLPVLMHLQFLSGESILYAGTTAQELFPRYKVLCDVLQREGRLPLWQDWLYGGSPFHANLENPTLYPPALIVARFASPVWTMNVLVLAHFGFAALGMFLLVRRLWLRMDASPTAHASALAGAIVGGTVFALAGWTRSEMLHGVTHGGTLAWLPWMLLAADALLEGARPRRAAGALALAIGMQVHSGNLHALVYGSYALALWMLLLGVCGGAERARRALGFGALALLLAGLIAGAKLLPFREWAAITNRAARLEYADALGMSMGGTGGTFEWALLFKRLAWYSFFGLLPALACLAWPLRRSPVVRTCFAIAALCLLIALGTPLHRLLYEFLPLFDSTRNAQRAWTGINAFLPILTGLGVCALVARRPALAARPAVSAGVGAALALLLLPALTHSFRYEHMFRHPERLSELPGLYSNWPEVARRCGSRWRATSLDLRTPDQRSEQFISSLLEVETPSGYLGHIWPRALELHLHGPPEARLDDATRLRRRATLSVRWLVATDPSGPAVSAHVLPHGIDGNRVLENTLARERAIEPAFVVALFGDADRAATYALLDDAAFPLQQAGTIQLDGERENSDEELAALAALVLRGEPSPAAARAARALRANDRPVLNLGTPLSEDDRAGLAELTRTLAEATRERSASNARFERLGSGASGVRREDAALGRWMLVSEAWSLHPGWRASTESRDGLAIEIADGVSSAVFLRPGEHLLQALYAPRSVTLGLWLFAVGVAAALLAALWPEPARPQPAPRPPLHGG